MKDIFGRDNFFTMKDFRHAIRYIRIMDVEEKAAIMDSILEALMPVVQEYIKREEENG